LPVRGAHPDGRSNTPIAEAIGAELLGSGCGRPPLGNLSPGMTDAGVGLNRYKADMKLGKVIGLCKENSFESQATEWSRTINPRFTKAVLCRLSYGGHKGLI